jgi:hypothetical protein
MSFKYLIPTLGVMSALMSACAPFNPSETVPNADGPTTAPEGPEMVDSPEQKRIRQAREEAARNADGGTEGNPGASDPPTNDGGTTTPGGSDYRRAILIPGKEGFVFNPFTNNPVDVRGIPSGTLVRDPQDPNTEHKFRVP